ncbi:hypothetical protein HQ325_16755 [Rhodococcus sp. BP-349]|uniref:hypothetical protein n=1 Tax=unclassified Rhodococcus (in: high G+C Gram-positive bacteria) TaxID=192944 RepID=UPI001C9ADF75|nr:MULTISPECIES: hypothetical protein [unclassified Rhodococcus (in: high G+C Gram-positive bacteria)]MBY6540326.1 hypothetical protein [Rhodococcus sp. BP-363]MBY6545649.1 hypothetical protein [Rhodococcus sp. BP-369]MBY6564879.1 hypothetical protein [Rhodococcus sp. BP-370]MBY6578185.1 hypothetical protein [Rhodococcus sp. BP-364]MBY6587486.1 hypothetical protein [Rhodococcus sp. BP-358]
MSGWVGNPSATESAGRRMVVWQVTFKAAHRSFSIIEQAADPRSAYLRMITEARRQLAEAGVATAPGLPAMTVMGPFPIHSTDLLDRSVDAEALADSLLAKYNLRIQAFADSSPKKVDSDPPAAPIPSGPLEQTWNAITELLDDHGVALPTPPEPWPGVLAEWYDAKVLDEPSVRFWFEQRCWRIRELFPTPVPVDPASSVNLSQMWASIEADFDHDGDESVGDDTAGSGAIGYDRRFVVIADIDGVSLVIDTRPGPQRGCIIAFTGAYIDATDVRWPDLNSLFEEVCSALTGGSHFAGRWAATVESGTLEWTSAGSATS